MTRRRARVLARTAVRIGVAALAALLLLPATAYASSPTPSVAIVSPAQGATVKGTVAIEATATAGAGDTMNEIEVFDGANEVGNFGCEDQPTCRGTVQWRATGLSGTHTLTARAYGLAGGSATSVPVSVTVVSPPPQVVVSSPAAGSTVKGEVTVSVSGETDPSQDEYPVNIDVFDGVNEIGSVDCQGQRTCAGSITWHATGLSGAHTLTAKLYTDTNVQALSPGVTVNVLTPPPTVSILSPKPGAGLRPRMQVKVEGATDPSLVDYPTSIDVFDGAHEIGQVSCEGQQTCGGSVNWDASGAKGPQTLYAVIYTERDASASSAHVVVGGSVPKAPPPRKATPRKPRRRLRDVSASCHLASRHIRDGREDHGICVVHGAPIGTRVAIAFRASGGRWVTIVKDVVGSGGRFRFRVRGKGRGAFALALIVRGTRVSKAARIPLGRVSVG
jgi:Bacterial Ig domain